MCWLTVQVASRYRAHGMLRSHVGVGGADVWEWVWCLDSSSNQGDLPRPVFPTQGPIWDSGQ